MKILNVDDNRENLYFLESLLRAHGHEVVSALNGVEALAELEKGSAAGAGFDLIVTDILMPEMDGFQLCRVVRNQERFRRIPVIVYTATYTSRQDEEFALSLGAARFLVKPAEPEQFMAEVAAVVLRDTPEPSTVPPAPDDEYLRVYNQRLIQKLERKVAQLEAAQKELTALVGERDREIVLRRGAEQDLQRSQEQLQLVWENSADGMLLTGAAGRILKVNAALAGMCGTAAAELVGTGAAQRLGWAGVMQDGRLPARFEWKMPRGDGSALLLEGAATPLNSSAGPVLFCLVRDVTEQRLREAERAALEAQLAEARKMETVGRLAGGIAHDFNNLLTVINGFSDMVLREMPAGGAGHKELTQIRAAGERAAELTGQLLAFSRRRETAEGELDLNQVIGESVAMLQRLVGDHIVIVSRLEPKLGKITGSAGQILQILMNLAANSRDAMPGGGTLTITTANLESNAALQAAGRSIWQTHLKPGPLVSLEVSDTGTGLAPEILPHVFDPFFTTKAGAGTGLGLFTVAGIVQRHGGAIAVRSTPRLAGDPGAPGGTGFEILFPRAQERPATRPAAPLAASARAEERTAGGETILVVDDRKDVRDLVVMQLRENGYQVLEGGSGEEALGVAARHAGAIHLLLTDLLMPDIGGRELAARMRNSRAGIKVLFMSGNPGPQTSGGADGGTHWIQKPFRYGELARKVRQVLDAGRGEGAGRAQTVR